MASRRVAERLKERLRAGPVTVKTVVETRFRLGSPGRLLVAEIPGRVRPEEHVVLVAHIQEPGANDNASGCGTLYEIARALAAAVAAKAIPPPARTITFVWGDEMRAGREWLRADAARAKNTRYMVALDMTGEDASKTGGSFLIEKEPDPSAVWPRPSDPHTEWSGGRSSSKAESLKGSLLNDLTLAVCLRRARDTRWNVQTNPYEGGSDHSVFLQSGIPALLTWHSTDRYYHTNLDRPDKTSPAEMANVGIAVGTTVALLASAGQEEARGGGRPRRDGGRASSGPGGDAVRGHRRQGGRPGRRRDGRADDPRSVEEVVHARGGERAGAAGRTGGRETAGTCARRSGPGQRRGEVGGLRAQGSGLWANRAGTSVDIPALSN